MERRTLKSSLKQRKRRRQGRQQPAVRPLQLSENRIFWPVREGGASVLAPDRLAAALVRPAFGPERVEERSLEGEFTDEGLIISRAEKPANSKAAIKPEAAPTEASEEVKSDNIEPDVVYSREEVEPIEPEIEPTEPKTTEAGGPGTPEVPPTAIGGESEPLPPPELPPEIREYEAMARSVPAATEAFERPKRAAGTDPGVSRKELEDEIYYAKKRGVSRGVLAGGITGWFLGRRSGRRTAEEQANKVFERKDEQIKALKNEQAVIRDRLQTVQASKENAPPEKLQAAIAEQAPLMYDPKPEIIPATAAVGAGERLSEQAKPELNKPKAEQNSEVKTDETEETSKVPAGRRVETSAWHTYEVDKNTGKIVEEQSFEYGEEFKKEKRAERLRREAMQPQIAIQVGQAVLTKTDTDEIQTADLQVTAASKADSERPSQSLPISLTEARQQLVRYTTSPVTWIAALALVVLLFAIGILR